MSEAYSKELIRKADEIAEEKGIKVQHGVTSVHKALLSKLRLNINYSIF